MFPAVVRPRLDAAPAEHPHLTYLEPWTYRIRCHFWCGIDLAPYPHLEAWHDRIERLPVILDALKVPSQDLVTRIKQDPELEGKIMDGMRKKREEEREKRTREEALAAE